MKTQPRFSLALALSGLVLNSVAAQPVSSGSFSLVGSISQFRRAHTATLLSDGKVLIPAPGKWSPTLPLVSGHRDHVAALLPNGKVLVEGGFNTSDTGPSTELYDPASAVATAFSLAQPTKLQTGSFQFTFRNTPGLSFTVLSATNLAVRLDDWTSLGSAAEVSPGHYQFTDMTPNSAQRFYRVRSP